MSENTHLERSDDHLYNDFSRLNNELANAQRELAKKNAELDRLNREKNQFLGIAAHDLRNPLEVILSYSRFLLDDASDVLDIEQIQFVNTIRSSSQFMLNLVNDFLDYSKIEAGKLELDLESIDFLKMVEENVKRNRILADKKDVQIDFEAKSDLPPLFIDETKIEQVLNNLIGNAVKFSPINGKVKVCVFLHNDGGNEVVLEIKDRGAGISPEELNKLFNPFEKGKSRATAGEKSTGLGLAIVKRIVEGHSGKITVESNPESGTAFSVSLPLKSRRSLNK